MTLGAEMGEAFACGLLQAAGVTGETLDLSAKLGGDRPTVLRVVMLIATSLTSVLTPAHKPTPKLARIV